MIKALEKSDIPKIFEIVQGAGDSLFTNLPAITEENVINEILRTDPGTGAICFVIRDGAGFMTLNNINKMRNSAFIGNIAVKKGSDPFLGVKSAKWLIDYCFDTLNLNRVYGHTWSDNPQMGVFYKRLGAVHEGIERQHTWKNGQYVDLNIWGILRSEWGK